MSIQIGILPEHAEQTANALQKLLADEVLLYIKTRNYHWNIEGPGFFYLHTFYQEQYEQLDEIMDNVAERIRSIGHYTTARMSDFLQLTQLSEGDYTTNETEQLKNLLMDHEQVIRFIRGLIQRFQDDYKDAGSADFITGVMESHEKMAWMIRSHLK